MVCCMEFIDFLFADGSQYYLYDKQWNYEIPASFHSLAEFFEVFTHVFSTNLCPASQWLCVTNSFLVCKYPRGKCLITSSFKPKDLFICRVFKVHRCPELPLMNHIPINKCMNEV